MFGTAFCMYFAVCTYAQRRKEIRCKAGRFKTYSPGAALYLLLGRLDAALSPLAGYAGVNVA